MKQAAKSHKSAKKSHKIVNRNYFARACRLLGRLLLFASVISFVGIGTLSILQLFQSPSSAEPVTAPVSPTTTENPAPISPVAVAFNFIVTAVIVFGAILGLCYLIYKYNDYARHFIAWVSRKAKAPVHFVELALPLFFWTGTIVMLLPTFPAITILFIFAFILNEFSFLFAWLAYGSPNYEN